MDNYEKAHQFGVFFVARKNWREHNYRGMPDELEWTIPRPSFFGSYAYVLYGDQRHLMHYRKGWTALPYRIKRRDVFRFGRFKW
jgi:hypothetical protein